MAISEQLSSDRIYAQRVAAGQFEFNDAVAEVFPDMIARSVPGYAAMLSMIDLLAARYVAPATNIYDLGCSLGAATLRVREIVPPSCVIHAIDNSPAMLSRLLQRLGREEHPKNTGPSRGRAEVLVRACDLRSVVVENASMVILNLTLQFVPVEERLLVLRSACNGMHPGGALLLSEKIHALDAGSENALFELHHDFKRANGYSDLEIAQKRTALEQTLLTEPLEEHLLRLKAAGFSVVTPWFQCFNFASILAIK